MLSRFSSKKKAHLSDVDLEAPGGGWAQKKYICRASELPPWYEPSEDIRGGYRVGYDGCACAASVFELHNQTLNVWTHFIPGVWFAWRAARQWAHVFGADTGGGATAYDEASVAVFLVAATAMLLCSAGYHTFGPISETAYRRWLAIDKCGIAAMIGGSFAPGVWLGFRCAPGARAAWCCVSVLVLVLGATLGLGIVPQHLHKRSFVLLVAVGLAPTYHFYVLMAPAALRLFLPRLFAMFLLYGLGLVFLQTRWPESQFPGRVDVFFASHQLWHVCITGAALAWYSDVHDLLAMIDARAPVVMCLI